MRKKEVIIYFLLIVFLAGALRFWGLKNRGLFYADETRYYRDGLRIAQRLNNCFRAGSTKNIKEIFSALSTVDKASFAGKPGHTYLGILGLYLFGNHQYSVLFISALFSILTVVLVFFMAKRFYDIKIGLISSLLLALCSVHILFSRSFLTHTNQAFFLVLATYLYLKNRFYLLTALLMGYAFLVHPTAAIYFMPFLICEISRWFKRKQRLGNILLFIILFLVPLFIIETIAIFAKKEFGSLAVAIKDSYLEQLIFTHSDAAFRGVVTNRNLGPFHYLMMSYLTNGAIFTSALVLGIFFAFGHFFKNRGFRNFVFDIVPLVFLFYWQFIAAHERLLREIVFLFPFFCIMTAVFISKLNRRFIIILLSVLVLEGLWHSSKIISVVKSDYPRVEKFLMENKVKKIITPSEYLATTADVLMPNLKDVNFYLAGSLDEAKDLAKREGLDYIVISPGNWLEGEGFRFGSAPVISIPEPSFIYFPSFYEAARTGDKMEWLRYYRERPEAASVGIYEINGS